MKKVIVAAAFLITTLDVFSQTPDSLPQATDTLTDTLKVNEQIATPATQPKKKDWSKVSLANRPNDHFMFQLGYEGWTGKPDSARTKGIPRTLNIYFMLDLPFKTDPRFSVGLGLGISSAGVYFDKTRVGVADNTNTLQFEDVSNRNNFKKYKLAYTYLEVPVELRFSRDPENDGKSLKFALGAKVGTLLNVHTKGKTLQDAEGRTIGNYTEKLASRQYFESIRLAGTARVGIGHFGLFGAYQINNFIKDGSGPNIRPFTIGFTFSGL
ncbi:MAG: outer membrane beta-barrel protein [Chitinophagaceae bacterium]|nr:outer membrane beta-barrel protein [Chitinophagaceae bacterium]